jgi:hypothetical protein
VKVSNQYARYVLYVSDDSRDVLLTKALLQHYDFPYEVATGECEEWPGDLAIYGMTHGGAQELVGGYGELSELLSGGANPGL